MQKKQNEGKAFIALNKLLYKPLFGLQTSSRVQSVKANIVLKNLCDPWSLNSAEVLNNTVQETMMIEGGKRKKGKKTHMNFFLIELHVFY